MGNRHFSNANANNSNDNENLQANQNGTLESTAPIIYITSGHITNDDADSTEIIFTNPYLMVGVENMMLSTDFQDFNDVFIAIEQNNEEIQDEQDVSVVTNKNENVFVDPEPAPWDIELPPLQETVGMFRPYSILSPSDEERDEQTTVPNNLFETETKMQISTMTTTTESFACSQFFMPNHNSPQQFTDTINNMKLLFECLDKNIQQK